MARTLGYANSPRALLIVSGVPVLGALVGIVVFFWILVTTVVAIRAALDFSTGRAVGTAILGIIAQGIVFGVAYSLVL